MIRATSPDDVAAVVELVIAARLFTSEEAELVEDLFADYFGGVNREGHASLVDEEDGILAAAYYKPHPAADRAWDLTMIAVLPEHQRHGRGSIMLRRVEMALRDAGQRLLLVETSGSPAYDGARAFYRRRGYDEEARIRDYWAEGDDMVVFRKDLDAPRTAGQPRRLGDSC